MADARDLFGRMKRRSRPGFVGVKSNAEQGIRDARRRQRTGVIAGPQNVSLTGVATTSFRPQIVTEENRDEDDQHALHRRSVR